MTTDPPDLPLTEDHLADLRRSGLTDDTVRTAGLRSVTDPAEAARLLNWTRPAAALGPCLAFPFPGPDGASSAYVRLKPSRPRARNGKPVKYESPRGEPNRAYVPPAARAAVADPAAPLLVTEGEKKALAATQAGFPTVALVGVYGWQKRRRKEAGEKAVGPRRLIPDLAAIPWDGRRVYLTFDSDAATNPNVARAEQHLAATLTRAGARVVVIRLPAGAGGAKQGLDDFLVARGPDALRELLAATGPGPADPGRIPKDRGEGLFRDDPELDRLAGLKLDDPAAFAAERAALRRRGVSIRDLDAALAPRVAALAAERRSARPAPAPGPGYAVRNGETCRLLQTADGEAEVPLANFAARVTAVTVRDDGAEARRVFTLEGRTAAGRRLPPADVPADQFVRMEWVPGAWGNAAVVYAGAGTRDHLRAAVQVLSPDAPERVAYAHLGWRETAGGWAYLHAAGAVGADGVAVAVDGPLAGFAFPPPPAGRELIAAVRASLDVLTGSQPVAPDRVIVPVLGAVYRAALGGVLDFGLHLHGPTGAFKSELAALAQQHHGAGLDARHLPANWASTANALEGAAFLAKDAVLVVDDFNPTGAADPQKLHAAADRLFRGLGNRAGRDRLTSDLTVRPPRPPQALVLSTGEDVPRGHSLRARVPVVEVRPGDVDPHRLAACQRDAAGGRYAAALTGYVGWLAPQFARVLAALPAGRAAARAEFLTGAAHARTPAAAGDLLVGWDHFTRFAVEVRALAPADREAVMARVRVALAGLVAAQADQLRAADPVDRFVGLVPGVLASGAAHLEALAGGPPTPPAALGWQEAEVGSGDAATPVWRPRGNRAGWADAAFVYLLPDAAFSEVQKLGAAQREPITMSLRTLEARLYDRGMLAEVDRRGEKVRYGVRVSAGGERVTVLKFRRDVFYPPADDPPSAAVEVAAGAGQRPDADTEWI